MLLKPGFVGFVCVGMFLTCRWVFFALLCRLWHSSGLYVQSCALLCVMVLWSVAGGLLQTRSKPSGKKYS